MPLSDDQIDRYSRQIVLPEIGGRGQERLLAATVVLAGHSELAAVAARYLAGAGIGALRLDEPALASFGLELRRLNPEVQVVAGSADAGTTVIAAADLAPAALDACARNARALGVPLVAAARGGDGGWLHVSAADACAACAARAVTAPAAASSLSAVATGVLGSLLALAALERALGAPQSGTPMQWFSATTSLLTPRPYERAAACPACAG
jgi:adenylyltransferase/sulfurtransferase